MVDLLLPAAVPLALYAHFPWCVRKCPYCDFNSHRAPSEIPELKYIDALLDDLQYDLLLAPPRPLISIFFGGGTPSLFSAEAIHRFLFNVKQLTSTDAALEVTMEANPGAIEHGRFAEYRHAGVNRISLGVQSFDDEQLKKLGRIHAAREVHVAAEELHRAGLDNFNIDLMYGLPGQTVPAAVGDVEAAIALHPAHLSHYQLTLEPGTAFFHRPPQLPLADESWEMQCACQEVLARAGYEQYEVSAYAQPGRRCVHNLNYWQFGDYYGLGAGAHGKLTDAYGITRSERLKQPREYLSQPSPRARVTRSHSIPPSERAFEFMLNALRLSQGFHRELFETRTGLKWTDLRPQFAVATARGMLVDPETDCCVPTEMGKRFLNDLQALFLD